MTAHLDIAAIARARAVPIADEIHRRGIKLRRVGLELVGACPLCGDGGKGSRSNRFAVHLRKNAWLCRRCQRGGGVVDLVMHLDGVGFKEAVAVLAGGKCPSPVPQRTAMARPVLDCAADEERKRQRALQWWEDASPIGGTPAEQYLVEIRKLVLPPDLSPRVLRFHPDCPFGDDGTRHPCLLALYRRIELPLFIPPDQPVEAEPRAVMRTALTVDGEKIGRMAYGPVRGAAIKLSDDADVTTGLVIGGINVPTFLVEISGQEPASVVGQQRIDPGDKISRRGSQWVATTKMLFNDVVGDRDKCLVGTLSTLAGGSPMARSWFRAIWSPVAAPGGRAGGTGTAGAPHRIFLRSPAREHVSGRLVSSTRLASGALRQ